MDWSWSDINYWAVLVSMVATMAVGFVWYSPVLFANQWAKLVGLKKEEMEGKAAPALIGAIVFSLIINLLIAVSLQMKHVMSLNDGIWCGVVIALIVTLSFAVNYLFERKSIALFLINAGYNIITILVATIILSTWR